MLKQRGLDDFPPQNIPFVGLREWPYGVRAGHMLDQNGALRLIIPC